MKRIVITNRTIAPLVVTGTKSTGNLNEVTDAEILSVALTGTGNDRSVETGVTGAPFVEETGTDMNALIMEAVSTRVEKALDTFLNDVKRNGILLEDLTDEAKRDIDVGSDLRGFTVFIDNVTIPITGGSLTLNGDLGIKVHYLGHELLSLETTGELTTGLVHVVRKGVVSRIPYALTLDGSNRIDLNGSFVAKIRRWKTRSMNADLSAAIVESDVTAMGSIGDRTIQGSVDSMNVLYTIESEDIVRHPSNLRVVCTGDIEARINGELVDISMLDPSYTV